MRKPKIELYADKAGKFRFRVLSANGEPIAASEAYESMATAKSTAKKLGAIAAKAEIVDLSKPVKPAAAAPKKK
ncbi:MAG: DUF1508 domain-containing protein [Candidatus Pacebacteria bacterium]|nr:DUF1508 domain-containing protein [Candidatus Paceibacterota bacterium]